MLLSGDTEGMKWFWIYTPMPFAGALLALFFHEFVYKRMQETVEEVEQHADGVLDNKNITDYED